MLCSGTQIHSLRSLQSVQWGREISTLVTTGTCDIRWERRTNSKLWEETLWLHRGGNIWLASQKRRRNEPGDKRQRKGREETVKDCDGAPRKQHLFQYAEWRMKNPWGLDGKRLGRHKPCEAWGTCEPSWWDRYTWNDEKSLSSGSGWWA